MQFLCLGTLRAKLYFLFGTPVCVIVLPSDFDQAVLPVRPGAGGQRSCMDRSSLFLIDVALKKIYPFRSLGTEATKTGLTLLLSRNARNNTEHTPVSMHGGHWCYLSVHKLGNLQVIN